MENRTLNKGNILVNMVRLDVTLTEEQYNAIEKLFDENNWEMNVNSRRRYVEGVSRVNRP